MSVAFLTAAFAAQIGKSSTKSVLIVLADRADDKTGLLYPSVADIIERTELDRKTVLNCLSELQQKKMLTDTGKRTGRTNQIKVWRLDFVLIQEASQKRDCSDIPSKASNLSVESVPKKEASQKRNCSNFPLKESRFSVESVPKTGHGTTNEPSFNHHLVVQEIDELVDAAVWAFSRNRGKIGSEAGFRHKVRTRILSFGTNQEDMLSLQAWRAERERLVKLAEQRLKNKSSDLSIHYKEKIKNARPDQLVNIPVAQLRSLARSGKPVQMD
jgi:hypothetical protein